MGEQAGMPGRKPSDCKAAAIMHQQKCAAHTATGVPVPWGSTDHLERSRGAGSIGKQPLAGSVVAEVIWI
jgi:hypothetical protein